RLHDVYPGVDTLYYANAAQRLEYDFVVAPGADPAAIRLAVAGADQVTVNAQGDLVLRTPAGDLVQQAPVVYQEVAGTRQELAAAYVAEGGTTFGFRVAGYDPALPLVLDPVLTYASYHGGSGDDVGLSLALDNAGNTLIAGYTSSTNFPTQGSLQTYQGAQD